MAPPQGRAPLRRVRLDPAGSEGDFLSEVAENEEVRFYVHQIHAHIRAWIARPGNEKLAAKVSVPRSLAGRDIVRMNPAALLKLCGGDHKLSQVMHNKLREEIARCSSKNLS